MTGLNKDERARFWTAASKWWNAHKSSPPYGDREITEAGDALEAVVAAIADERLALACKYPSLNAARRAAELPELPEFQMNKGKSDD